MRTKSYLAEITQTAPFSMFQHLRTRFFIYW